MPIRILPEELIKKIAAGEVIERPSSVVKELLENSIDAQSKKIEVYIENAGKKSIRVIDDGCGISKNEIRLSVKHHATSKISDFDDLFKIRTMGFRGEALASIATVSRLTITSREKEEKLGSRVVVKGGKEELFTEIGCPYGTEVIVEELFFNTPARRRFLKKDTTETRNIIKVLTPISMSHPKIEFSFYNNNKKIFNYKTKDGNERIKDILTEEIFSDMIHFENNERFFKVKGFISKQGYLRRDNQYIFVNNRYVSSNIVAQAIVSAYRDFNPGKGIPYFVIFIEIEPSLIDINVHPTKKEVKFLKEQDVYRAIFKLITKTFEKKDFIINYRKYDFKKEEVFKEQELNYLVFPGKTEKKEDIKFLGKSYKIFGQVFKKYILFSSEDNFYIMDQHTASERLKYEDLKTLFQKSSGVGQRLLMEEKIAFSPDDYSILNEHKPILKSVGIDWENFGPGIIKLKTIPSLLPPYQTKKLMKDLIVLLEENTGDKKRVIEVLYEDILKIIACRSAVKAGDELNNQEIEELVKKILNSKSIYCPHGRPVLIKITESDLDKFFDRK